MANILTADDATFAATTGNWIQGLSTTAVTRQTTPTSPDGNNICRLERTGTPPGNGNVTAQIPRDIYPVAPGDEISMELAYSVPGTNAGTGTLICQIAVNLDPASSAGGVGYALASSDPFTKGDGWHEISIAEFTVPALIGGEPPAWVSCSVRFFPWTGTGIVVGDYAYFSDVSLGKAAVGGWAVGMVRMGAG